MPSPNDDGFSFDPKTWVDKAAAPTAAPPLVARRATAGGRMALAVAIAAALLIAAALAAYLTRAPARAAAVAVTGAR